MQQIMQPIFSPHFPLTLVVLYILNLGVLGQSLDCPILVMALPLPSLWLPRKHGIMASANHTRVTLCLPFLWKSHVIVDAAKFYLRIKPVGSWQLRVAPPSACVPDWGL